MEKDAVHQGMEEDAVHQGMEKCNAPEMKKGSATRL